MSDRHMHITSYLYDEDPARVAAFEAGLRNHFVLVQPVTISNYGKDLLIAFALYSKDGGSGDDKICTLPRAVQALAGILTRDIEIVSAWEGGGDLDTCVWHVRGSGAPDAGFTVPEPRGDVHRLPVIS